MLNEIYLQNLEHDVKEFTKYGGRIIQVAKHPTVAGDKHSGKWSRDDSLLKKIGWKDANKNNLSDIESVKDTVKTRNIGLVITDPNCCIVCLDCDADTLDDLKKDESGDVIDPFNEFYKSTLITYTNDPETLHFKAFFAIKDPETLRGFKNAHASQKDKPTKYEVFLPTNSSRWLVIAPSIHGEKLMPVVSNGRDIKQIYAREFADLVCAFAGLIINPEDEPVAEPQKEIEQEEKTSPKTSEKKATKGLKFIPSVEETLKPLLRNPRAGTNGWINGIITDGNEPNAGYNAEKDFFHSYASKGKWANQSGGRLLAFAIANELQWGNYTSKTHPHLEGRPHLDGVWLKAHGYRADQGESGFNPAELEEFEKLCRTSADEIKKEEISLIQSTPEKDVLTYLASVVNLEHVGDTSEIKLILLALMMRYDLDSRGSIIFVGGSRGSGKSDMISQIVKLFPKWEKMSSMISPKALWYEHIPPKTIFTIEEQDFTDEFQEFVKLSQSNWDEEGHRIVAVSTNKGVENQYQTTPIRMQIISVRATQTGDEQVANRGFSITLSETPEKKKALIDLMNRDRSDAHRRNESRRAECLKRAETILQRLPNSFRCNFPFEITYPDYIASDPRQMRIFNSLVSARAFLRQAFELTQKEFEDCVTIEAAETDFWDVLDVINGCFCTSLKQNVEMRAGVGNQIVDTLKSIDWEHAPFEGARCLGYLLGDGKFSYAVPYDSLALYFHKDKSTIKKALNGRREGDPNAITNQYTGFARATAATLALDDVDFRQLKSNWLVVTPGYWRSEEQTKTAWAVTPRV